MKDVLSNSMVVGMGLAFLWHFSNIVRYGSHYIQEPNPAILVAEITLLVGIVVWGIVRLIKLFGKEMRR